MEFKTYKGNDILTIIKDLAFLRVTIFREWPYLYEGNLLEEIRHLKEYATNPIHCVVTLEEEGVVLGAMTGLTLESVEPKLAKRLPGNNYYIGEFLILQQYRGNGYGELLYQKSMEEFKKLQLDNFIIAIIKKNKRDHRCPKVTRNISLFARKKGFKRMHGVTLKYAWQEVGSNSIVKKQLQCYIKSNNDE